MKYDLCILGGCTLDEMYFQNIDGTYNEKPDMVVPGGKGANQAVAAARLGGRVSFMAKVGNDHFGSRSIEQYKSEGIEVEHILVDNDNPSGVALIMVDAKGENCIAVASGANALLRPEDIDKATDTIERGDIVLMQLETPLETVEYASRIARENIGKINRINNICFCRLN